MTNRFAALLVLLLSLQRSAHAEMPLQLWQYSLPVRFSGYSGSGELRAFPVLIELGPGHSGFSYSQFAAAEDAGDLRFMSASGAELPYEIDGWSTAGVSRVWVQVPLLTANTVIHCLWGRPGASAPSYRTDGTVWTNGFLAVWHFGDEANATVATDSAADHDASRVGNVTLAESGCIGRAVSFDGVGDWLSVSSVAGLVGKPSVTVSAWHYLNVLGTGDAGDSAAFSTSTASDPVLLWYNYDQASPSPGYGGRVYTFNAGSVSTSTRPNANRLSTGSNTAKAGIWQFVAGVANGTTRRIYLNGVEKTSRTDALATTVGSTTTARIGSWSNASNMDFDGRLDELRVSTVERSAAWLQAEWFNVASNSVFCSYGNVSRRNVSAVLIQ